MSTILPVPQTPPSQAERGTQRTTPPRPSPLISGMLADRIFGWLARSAAVLTLLLLIGILVSLVLGAWPSIEKYGLSFLTRSVWDPVQNEYGGLVMIYGTLATSVIALLIAVPVSFGIALFLTELSPAWLKRPLGTAIELLAAVPSIVYGMWGLMVFGPILARFVQQPLQAAFSGIPYLGAFVSGPPVGIGILSAGIILAIMIIPFIASVMRDVFEVTPPLLKESAYGLGSTTWEVVSKVVLPYTKTGVVGGINLMNRHRVLAMMAPYPAGELGEDGLIPGELLQELGQQYQVFPWAGFGTIYGTYRMVGAAQKEISAALSGISTRLVFLTPQSTRTLSKVSDCIPGAAGKRLGRITNTLSKALDLVNGLPNETALPLAYWRNPMPMGPSLDPSRDGCGLIWYAPLVPMRPKAARMLEASASSGFVAPAISRQRLIALGP